MSNWEQYESTKGTSKQKYMQLLEAIPQLVWSAKPNGNVDFYNVKWRQYCGYDLRIGFFGFSPLLHPDDVVLCKDTFCSSLAEGNIFEIKCRLKRHDGVFRWFLIRAEPVCSQIEPETEKIVKLQHGECLEASKRIVTSYFGTCTDVDDQQKAQESLNEARLAAERMAELKSQWVANMSHEIRTPLNGILGNIELLIDTPMSAEQKEYAETIHHSTLQLITIINDILDFRRNEVGHVVLRNELFSPFKIVEEVCNILSSIACAKGTEFAHIVSLDVPQLCRGDPARLRQILVNLIGNSIKFVTGRNNSVFVKCGLYNGICSSPSSSDHFSKFSTHIPRGVEKVLADLNKTDSTTPTIDNTDRSTTTPPSSLPPSSLPPSSLPPSSLPPSSLPPSSLPPSLSSFPSYFVAQTEQDDVNIQAAEVQAASGLYNLKHSQSQYYPNPQMNLNQHRNSTQQMDPNNYKETQRGSSIEVENPEVCLRFDVVDSGPGIDISQQAKLFQEFSQVDGSDTRSHGGTGLGLAISKQLVEAFRGDIWVSSAKDQGAVFSFTANFENTDSTNQHIVTLEEEHILIITDKRNVSTQAAIHYVRAVAPNAKIDCLASAQEIFDIIEDPKDLREVTVMLNLAFDELEPILKELMVFNERLDKEKLLRKDELGPPLMRCLVITTTQIRTELMMQGTLLGGLIDTSRIQLEFITKPVGISKLSEMLKYTLFQSEQFSRDKVHHSKDDQFYHNTYTHSLTENQKESLPDMQTKMEILNSNNNNNNNNNNSQDLNKVMDNMDLLQLKKNNTYDANNNINNNSNNNMNNISKPTVLVVEDNKVNLKVLIRQLKKLGFDVTPATDGAMALEMVAEQRLTFNLILMDLQMPIMDGIIATSLIREYQAANNLKRIPIIAISANTSEGIQGQCIAAGMDGYLSKPIQVAELSSMLQSKLL